MRRIFQGSVSTLMMLAMVTCKGGVGSSHPAEEYIEGDVIVTFKPSIAPVAARLALTGHSMGWQKRFDQFSQRWGKESGVVHVPNRTTAALIAELSRDPAVETAEPNYLRWVTTASPNDSCFSNLWALKNTGQTVNGSYGDIAGTAGADIRFIPCPPCYRSCQAARLARCDAPSPG